MTDPPRSYIIPSAWGARASIGEAPTCPAVASAMRRMADDLSDDGDQAVVGLVLSIIDGDLNLSVWSIQASVWAESDEGRRTKITDQIRRATQGAVPDRPGPSTCAFKSGGQLVPDLQELLTSAAGRLDADATRTVRWVLAEASAAGIALEIGLAE